jgi:hypothetical protein
MGSRDPDNARAASWAKEAGAAASKGTFSAAARFGELLVLATAGVANESVLRAAGPDDFAGKVLIDATNPLDFSNGVPPSLAFGHTDSGGERVQRLVPGAAVVKAFNTVGAAHMFRPNFEGGPPDMFICGDDADAKQAVTRILRDFGWPSIDLGGIEASRLLEPMAALWVRQGIRSGSWGHAFKLLGRS